MEVKLNPRSCLGKQTLSLSSTVFTFPPTLLLKIFWKNFYEIA